MLYLLKVSLISQIPFGVIEAGGGGGAHLIDKKKTFLNIVTEDTPSNMFNSMLLKPLMK